MWWLWQRGHCSGRSCHRSLWIYAWHCSTLKRWCKWESTGIAENLLVLGHRFCNWEILTCSGRFYTPTNREKLSEKYIEQVGEDGFQKAPVGLGPYKFVSYTPGGELVLEAYDGYWRKVPNIKRLIFKGVPDGTTRLAMLKAGEADIVFALEGQV